jgi:hypothetical protein
MKKILLLLFVSLTMQSCFIIKSMESSNMRSGLSEKNNAIPPDFGKDNTVLLIVLRGYEAYDKYAIKAAKGYLGEYKLIKQNELSDEKYSDLSKYRYVFDFIEGSTKSVYYTDTKLTSNYTLKNFFVYDRKINKMYNSGSQSSFYALLMKAYFENLEAKRKSFI